MLNWHKSSLPNHVQLRVSVDNGSSYRIVAQSSVPSHDSAEMYMPLETPVLATNLSCICTGFAKCNQEQNRSHKLERVRVHKPVPGVPNVSTRLLVQTMTAWLTKVASAPPNSAYASYVPPLVGGLAAPPSASASASAPPSGYALAALEMMALASGSLDTLLTLVNLLFRLVVRSYYRPIIYNDKILVRPYCRSSTCYSGEVVGEYTAPTSDDFLLLLVSPARAQTL